MPGASVHRFRQLPIDAGGDDGVAVEHELQESGHKSLVSFPFAALPIKSNCSAL